LCGKVSERFWFVYFWRDRTEVEVEEREIVTKCRGGLIFAFTLLPILCQDTVDSLERAKTGVKRQQDSSTMNGLPNKPIQPSGSKPHRPETLAKSHLAHSSIRGQTARQKQKQKEQQKGDTGAGSASGGNAKAKDGTVAASGGGGKKNQAGAGSKPFVKAVLANPLAPQW
jgi:hypothetical protein